MLVIFFYGPQGLSGPRWQQLASRQFSVSAGLCGADGPPTRADATFKVTMIPGDGVGPELMTAVKDVFKVYLKICIWTVLIRHEMQILKKFVGIFKC